MTLKFYLYYKLREQIKQLLARSCMYSFPVFLYKCLLFKKSTIRVIENSYKLSNRIKLEQKTNDITKKR